MVRIGDLYLNLLSRRYSSVERPGAIENSFDQPVIFIGDRPGKFAPDEEMGQISQKPQIREPIKEIQGEEKVGGHPIAMRLDQDRYLRVLSQPSPAFEQRQAVFNSTGTNVRLQADVMNAELGGILENGFQIVDRLRKTLAFGLKAGLAKQGVEPLHIGSIMPMCADPIETCSSDPLHILLDGEFRAPAAAQFHRPKRLKHQK
ncbi:hypothetical protein AC244_25565 [Ensifer adhaerens]|uniref:Uncharacterized protein n=1 Tax=Ensifer adhaerens TaxID=106592 RepID=A0A0L8BK92_ENSAD|nr:hypothetical protein AC244_25565 [Ensifer adhaerens]